MECEEHENIKTLLECLEIIEDPRASYSKKHHFLDIMAIAILAVISGADTWDDMKDWGIENSLHWVLDIAYREDESRTRTGNSAENLNILRQMTLNMLKQEKSCRRGIAGKRKKCGWDNEYLLKVLNTVEPSN